ncbi:lipid-binding SYLF domain-containing protein [Desulfogranum japonicum]|uniref:lipid-binding SYLF domain-containing protein n=1 Tax=Desulfogranum japonicum TaxID=231447 RepID=UPI00042024E4|nr:lipid-binding SYLF domain-containing protein [Desulfogranum japonicum]
MRLWKITTMLFLLSIFTASQNVCANDKMEAENLVNKASIVVRSFSADPDMNWFREKVKDAKALIIVPQSIKGAFLIGGSGGSGVLVARDTESGEWGDPAFYSVGSLSVGLQIGAEASEAILMIMSERGMEKLLTSSFKLGVDGTVAAGPVGKGARAQTADVITYSRAKGAFMGMSFDGALIKPNDKRNQAYYDQTVSPTDIIIRKKVTNPQADTLREMVSNVTRQ